MEAAGQSDHLSRRPRVDGVVSALSRLVATARDTYREPLLDVLYQYRRREGVFSDRPRDLYARQRRERRSRPSIAETWANFSVPVTPLIQTTARAAPATEQALVRRRPTPASKGGHKHS